MEVFFATEQLARSLGSDRGRARRFGQEAARRLDMRLQQLRSAPTLHDARDLPGQCRELTFNPDGSFGIDVQPSVTLIFRPHDGQRARHSDGGVDWTAVDAIVITAVMSSTEKGVR